MSIFVGFHVGLHLVFLYVDMVVLSFVCVCVRVCLGCVVQVVLGFRFGFPFKIAHPKVTPKGRSASQKVKQTYPPPPYFRLVQVFAYSAPYTSIPLKSPGAPLVPVGSTLITTSCLPVRVNVPLRFEASPLPGQAFAPKPRAAGSGSPQGTDKKNTLA